MDDDDVKEVHIPATIKYRWFNDIVDIDKLKQLRITRYAMYTTSLPDHTEFLLDVLKLYFVDLRQLTITDATSCIGGNARMFVGQFDNVNIVDISKLHIDILRHNFNVLELKGNYRVYKDNYLNICTMLDQDIIFLDVPWGGVDYKLYKCRQLFLLDKDRKPVFLQDLIEQKLYLHTKMIVVKVPKTYDISIFYEMGVFKSVKTINVMRAPGRLIYSMVILSHIQPSRIIPTKRILSSVNYRDIMYTTR